MASIHFVIMSNDSNHTGRRGWAPGVVNTWNQTGKSDLYASTYETKEAAESVVEFLQQDSAIRLEVRALDDEEYAELVEKF